MTHWDWQGDWNCLALSKEQGRVRRVLQKVETEHIMFQQLWDIWQSVLPAVSSRVEGCKKDPKFLLQRGAKSLGCWRGSSSFPSVFFPADLCRQWDSRCEWGKAFLEHLVYVFDKVDIPSVFCIGTVSSVRKHHFRSPRISFQKVPLIHFNSTVGVKKKSKYLKKKWLWDTRDVSVSPLTPTCPMSFSFTAWQACSSTSLFAYLLSTYVLWSLWSAENIPAFWTQGQNPSFQSAWPIFMLIFLLFLRDFHAVLDREISELKFTRYICKEKPALWSSSLPPSARVKMQKGKCYRKDNGQYCLYLINWLFWTKPGGFLQWDISSISISRTS